MNVYIAEFVGTALLVLLGDAVIANVVLSKTKGSGGGGGGVDRHHLRLGHGSVRRRAVRGQHLAARTSTRQCLSRWPAAGKFEWDLVPGYITAQMLGGIFGAILMWMFYHPHFAATQDADAKLGVFCNAPTYRNMPWALFCEIVGTFVLVFAVMAIQKGKIEPAIAGTATSMTFELTSHCAMARWIHRARHRPVSRRNDRLRDQPGPRPRSAHRARHPARRRQARQRLGLRMGSRHRADPRRPACRVCVSADEPAAGLMIHRRQPHSGQPALTSRRRS